MTQCLRRFADDQQGAAAIEYGMLAALIAVGAIVALTGLGDAVRGLFDGNNAKAAAVINAANAKL